MTELATPPAADQAGRHHRHLVQELLDALGAEQRAVQFPEISGVSDFFSVCSRHGIASVSFSASYPQLARQTRPREPGPGHAHRLRSARPRAGGLHMPMINTLS